MKTELTSYIRQLKSIYNGRPWCGDSLLQKLEQIGAKEAFATPAPNAHSVAQLTAHITAWRRVEPSPRPDFQHRLPDAGLWAMRELLTGFT
jgi:hypothetical protein